MNEPGPGHRPEEMTQFPTVSVVIAAFTMDRWDHLKRVVASVHRQTVPVLDTVVVIDHNPDLLARARAELQGVAVVSNAQSPGASGARNSGVEVSHGEIVVFLDDDIVVSDSWLEAVLPHFTRPEIVGVGGRAEPAWQDSAPAWFPAEFNWVVGAHYVGMPEQPAEVRNVWSNNMAVRRGIFDAIGGFREDFGKVRGKPRPEDTDLCLRAAAARDHGSWIYEPRGVAAHWVPPQRAKFSYFLYRCFHEGSGKAQLAALNGVRDSTSLEGRYVWTVLTRGIARGARRVTRGDVRASLQSLSIIFGCWIAALGFVAGWAGAGVQAQAGRRYRMKVRDADSGFDQMSGPEITGMSSRGARSVTADQVQNGIRTD